MTTWCKKLALVLALTVMPLQGVAAAFSILLCHGDAKTHAMHVDSGHDHGAHNDGHHDSQQSDGNASANAVYHLCCNVTASAPPIVTFLAAPPNFPVQAFAPDPLHDLFIPDRPQRPPLA